MKLVRAFTRHDYFLYFFAISASILLSVWIDSHETVINPDAICYLLSAETIGSVGLHGAMHLCGQAQWPFYPLLIYSVVQISHVSYLASAYILNSFFSLLSVLAFIFIVKELGGCKRTLWLAAGVILLSHQFNGVREYIIRDHGFWACYLISFVFLLRYFEHPRRLTALAFSFSLLMAALFRIEGIIFLITLPFLSWLTPRISFSEKLQRFILLNLLIIIITFMAGGYLLFHPQPIDQLGRLADLSQQLQHGATLIVDRFTSMKIALSKYVLPTDSINDAGLVLILVFLGWYIISVINNLSWIYAFLVLYAWKNAVTSFKPSARLVLYGYLFTNIIITLFFLIERGFLSNRYLLALSFIFMLWVPFALNALIEQGSSLRHRLFLWFTLFLIVLTSLGGIFDFGYSKTYIREAGHWLAVNTPPQAALFSNQYQVLYYSQRFGNRIFDTFRNYANTDLTDPTQWKKYDYFAFQFSHNKNAPPFLHPMNLMKRLQVFQNQRGDRVEIYKRISN